jgi:phosphatidylglycerophosphate synthase
VKTSDLDQNGVSTAGTPTEHGSAGTPRPTIRDLRSFQPPRLSEGYIGLFYREVSLPLIWLFVRIGVTANQVTLLWIAAGLISSGLLASGNYWWTIVGALFLQLALLLDRADGDVARYTDNRTLYGKYLDLLGHTLIKSVLFVCVGLGVYATRPQLWVLLLGITGMLGISVGTHLRFYRAYLLVIRNLKFEERPRSRNLVHKVVRKLENLWWTHGLFGVVLVGAVTNQMIYVLIFYGVTALLWALSVSLRISQELRVCDSDPSRYKPEHEGLDAFD